MTGEGEPPVGADEGTRPEGAGEGKRPDPSTDGASEAVQPEDASASTGDVDVAFPDGTDASGASTAGETGISTLLQIYEAEEDLVNVNFEIQLSVSDDSNKKTAASDEGKEGAKSSDATASESEEEDKENEGDEESVKAEEDAAGEDKENEEEKEEKENEEKAGDVGDKLAPPPGPPPGRGRSFSLGRTRSLSVLRRKHDENRASRKKKPGAAASKGKTKPPLSPKAKKPADKAKAPPADKDKTVAADEDKAPAEKCLMPGKSMETQRVSNAGKGHAKGQDQDAFWDDASRSSKNSRVLLGDGEMVPAERRSRLGKSIKNMRTRSMSRKKALAETRSSSKKKKAQTKTPKKELKKMRGRSRAARDKEGKQQPKQEEAEKKDEEKGEGSPRGSDKRPDGARGAFELLGASRSEDNAGRGEETKEETDDGATQEGTAPKKARPRRRYIPLRFRSPLGRGRRGARDKSKEAAAEAALKAEAELDRALDEEFAKDPGWEKGAFEGAVWLHSMEGEPKAVEQETASKRDGGRDKSADRHDRHDDDLRTKSTNGTWFSGWSSAASRDDSRAVTTWTEDATSASASYDDTTAFLLKDEAAAGFEVAKGLLGITGLGVAGLCRHPQDCRMGRDLIDPAFCKGSGFG